MIFEKHRFDYHLWLPNDCSFGECKFHVTMLQYSKINPNRWEWKAKSEERTCSWNGILDFLDSGRKIWMLDSGHWTLDAGLWMLDSGLWTLDAVFWMLYSGRWTLDAGPWTLYSGCWTLDAVLWMLDSGCWTLDTGCWMLDSEPWTQDIGLWMLNARLWMLAL